MTPTERITGFINALKSISGTGICYYDLENFFNFDILGKRADKGHHCKFCEYVRSLDGGMAKCEKSDRNDAVLLADQYKTPFFFECHMGIRELVVPVLDSEKLLGILFVGQCRIEGEDTARIVKASSERFGQKSTEIMKLYYELPCVERDTLINAGTILERYFETGVFENKLRHQKGSTAQEGADTASLIKSYIDSNYHCAISSGKIAKRFYISPGYASRCFSKKYGMTVTDYINSVRCERARELILTTHLPISSIAVNVGFSDPGYFSGLFTKKYGVCPKSLRDR